MYRPDVKPNTPEFPELDERSLKEVLSLCDEITNLLGRYIVGFGAYTGSKFDQCIGQHTIYNGVITAQQLEFAMAMTRSPVLVEMISNKIKGEALADALVQNKIMNGMKVLDLGSGPTPTFARCCRAMGADAWTVDVLPITKDEDEMLFSRERAAEELAHHLVLNLEPDREETDPPRPPAIQVIQGVSGGDFNLVTECNLETAGSPSGATFYGGYKIGMELLRKGGVYYHANLMKAILKE